MAQQDYVIAALWMQGSLSYLEQLCLKSFVDAGHYVRLYHYGLLKNVPDGIELADANDILPQTNILQHSRTGSPALHSDLFRYRMLATSDKVIWADTDAYCRKRFTTPNGHFYGWESDKYVNGGVLGMPQDSETLGELLDYTQDEFAIPCWYGEEYERELETARDAGNPVHASEQPWGVWGPHAVTHFLKKTGEIKYALPREALYPFTFKERRLMLKRKFDFSGHVTEYTFSIHFYGRRMRKRLVESEKEGKPHHKSLIGLLLKKHGVNPDLAPLPRATQDVGPKKDIETPHATTGTASTLINLTDLAEEFGSDKGARKHRYTELYQLLFLPYKDRKINFLEMGLLIGGPEHGIDKDRVTNDVPSIRMWLKFFKHAKIHGLDVSDFSWFKDDRFEFFRCDMDARENIRKASLRMPEMTIIIDDASHASHHQQFGFLDLFGKLKTGGIYVIEDLRWQPEGMEKPGITKTADLFYGFQTNREFQHSDKAMEAEFNSLASQISGCFVFQAGYNKIKRDQVAVIHKR